MRWFYELQRRKGGDFRYQPELVEGTGAYGAHVMPLAPELRARLTKMINSWPIAEAKKKEELKKVEQILQAIENNKETPKLKCMAKYLDGVK